MPKHFCALLFLPAILAAQTPAVSGRWFATVDFHGTPLYFNMKLEQRGAAITGQFGGDKLEGAINGEVVIELPGGKLVVASITNESIHELGLTEGKRACALIKASHIILAVSA